MRFVPPSKRRIVKLFPYSTSPGLNAIAFNLMGRSAAGRSLRLHMLAFRRSHDYSPRKVSP